MKKNGFTLIEFLIGMTMTVAIFILATNLVVSFLSIDTKSRWSQEVEHAKSDVSSELTNALQWGNDTSFVNGRLTANGDTYTIQDGLFMKNGSPFTLSFVKSSNFNVSIFSSDEETSATGDGTGLVGRYYNNMDFTELVATRIDPEIHFIWLDGGKPHPALEPGTFAIQWAGQIKAPDDGTYTFWTQTDDGVRLWVNDVLLIDNWVDHVATIDRGTINLVAGKFYPIRLEYYNRTRGGRMYLSWIRPGKSLETIPTEFMYNYGKSNATYKVNIDFEHERSSFIKDSLNLFVSPRSDTEVGLPVPSATPPPPSSGPNASPTPTGVATPTPTPLR